jgi:heme exporter protein C
MSDTTRPASVPFWHYFANPARFQRLAQTLLPVLWVLSAALLGWGLWLSLAASPPDWQQSETVRIMYVHVPAAWLGMAIYAAMAAAALSSVIWRHLLADLFIRAAAPVGAAMTLLCLVTGSLWGKPMWGTWWVWDARLTSMLVLFFLYLGYIVLAGSFDDPRRGERMGAILVLLGALDLPIVKFSVNWWNTLHQPASLTSLSRLANPALPAEMLVPLLVMAVGFTCLAAALCLYRVQTEILARRLAARRLTLAGGAP